MVEKRTGEHTTRQGHEGYVVIRTEQELNVQPIEMEAGKWYEPVLEIARAVKEKIQEVIR